MKDSHPAFPNGVQAICLIAVLFFVQMLVHSVVHATGLPDRMNPADLGALATTAGNLVLLRWLLSYKQVSFVGLLHPAGHSVQATLMLLSVPVLLLVPGLLVSVGFVVGRIEAAFPMSPEEQAMFAEISTGGLITLIFACVAAPLIEEVLFRGIILRSFLQQYSRWSAIVGSALLFGLFHLNIYQFATGTILGVVMGWLYERSRSLWPCILLHSAYNAATIYLPADLPADSTVIWLLPTVLGGYLLTRFLRADAAAPAMARSESEID
jgi:membrane protease YdiL (CAAX protease family)